MLSEEFPQYVKIALHVASKIAEGDFPVGKKISGSSKLASAFGVSPETVRRAMQLLADMKVVEIREQSGVYARSVDNAQRYLRSFQERSEFQERKELLRTLIEQRMDIDRQLLSLCSAILESQELRLPTERSLPNYEVRVSPGSDKIGRNLVGLHFWQSTGATIVAIRRGNHTIISPGPDAELYEGDVVIFVGTPETVKTVRQYLNGESPDLDAPKP